MSIFNGKVQYIDKCTEVDHHDDVINYNGELIKWTSGKDCKKIIYSTD